MLEKLIKKYAKKYEGMPIALSGGIDSSLLAALIKPKFAITVELPQGKHNEIYYAKQVAKHLKIKHIIVEIDDSKWDKYMPIAVKAIGRPIPHFNIFPLFFMYQKLQQMGEKELVLGDGPDETMCGYTRDLIINYLYKIYDFEAFRNYKPLIDKILPPINETIERIIKNPISPTHKCSFKFICGHETGMKHYECECGKVKHYSIGELEKERGITEDFDCGWKFGYGDSITDANIRFMRPDMDDMSNGIAKYFGITNHRPYQDNKELDNYMYSLPLSAKIQKVEYGKFLLRKVAENYLPKEIVWRKEKVGGPVYPVNLMRSWLEKGEFDKEKYLEYQQNILNEKK